MKKICLLIIVNIIVVVFLCEAGGLIWFYSKNGKFFYTRFHQSGQQNIEQNRNTANVPHQSNTINTILHPYWGFITRPGLALREYLPRERLDCLVGPGVTPDWLDLAVNEYGFYSKTTYPYSPQKNEFVIGIFGGSVAHWFRLQGSKTLIEHLQKHPLLRNKVIKVLSFAQGAFKQPQQLQILTYFLARGQHFDFVINIDGFNEVALSHLNYQSGIELSMPSSQEILPIANIVNQGNVDVERLAALLQIAKTKQAVQNIKNRMERNYSAGLNLFFSAVSHYRETEYIKAVIKGDTMNRKPAIDSRASIIQINRLSQSTTSKNEFESMAQFWARCSILIQQLLESQDVGYLHVLQPNQYFSRRSFKNEELSAIDNDSPYKPGAEQGYPFLLGQIDNLQRAGVHFANLTGIFDIEPRIIYSDSCCHYNQLGNDLLAAKIAQDMIPILDETIE